MSNFADEQAVSDYYAERPDAEHDYDPTDDWTDEDFAQYDREHVDPWGIVPLTRVSEPISLDPPF